MNLSRLFSGCICFVIGCAVVSSLTGLVATASAADNKEEDSIYMRCLRKLPTTLKSSSEAPETMQFLVPIKDYAVDYEKEISGEGWGASLKYRNVACEVVVYAYDHARNGLTDADARKERDEFDGFSAESIFEKEAHSSYYLYTDTSCNYCYYDHLGMKKMGSLKPRKQDDFEIYLYGKN